MLHRRPIIIAICCAIAIVASVYFGGPYILEQGRVESPSPSATSASKALISDKANLLQADQHEEDQHLNNPLEITGTSSSRPPAMSENEQNTANTLISAKPEAADVPVSPHGFGPYPELPPDYPKNFWDDMSKEHELIARVRLKLNAEGRSMRNGLVYLNFRDTIYVKWDWNGKQRYITKMIGHPDTIRSLRTFPPSRLMEKDIPEDIKVYTMPDGGIDPYEFLNLKK